MTTRREFLKWAAAGAGASLVPGLGVTAEGPAGDFERLFHPSQWIGRVTGTTALLSVLTGRNSAASVRARVRWAEAAAGLDGASTVSDAVPAAGVQQRIELPLSGLKSGTEYVYRVEYAAEGAPAAWAPAPTTGRFVTQRPRGTPFRFAIVADGHWTQGRITRGGPRWWTGMQCLRQVVADAPFDFCIDLGDSPFPTKLAQPQDAVDSYLKYRALMADVARTCAQYLVLGNHEQEAGFFQRGDGRNVDDGVNTKLAPDEYHQRWATEARLLTIPNPTGSTYPEGGEGAPGARSEADWVGAEGPWCAGPRDNLQNFYAFTWSDALFVVVDPFRCTAVGETRLPSRPEQWTLGPTQLGWLERTLRESDARWKFLFSHHLVGGGEISGDGYAVTHDGGSRAYGRGSAADAVREGTEQARIHAMMVAHGAQFFVYGHDHCFCHSVRDSVNYLCCGRPTFLNDWIDKDGMRASYGDVEQQGRNKPWVRALYNALGYTRFSVTPDQVTIEWVRTGFSFLDEDTKPDRARRDWQEGWFGREFPVDSASLVRVELQPIDVDNVRTVAGVRYEGYGVPPSGMGYYLQPFPQRPEKFARPEIPLREFPEKIAVVDAVPDIIYRHVWSRVG